MKKALLIGAVLMSGVSGFAQNARHSANHTSKTLATNRSGRTTIENNNAITGTSTKRAGGHNSVMACPAPVTNNGYTSGPNFFGVGGGATTYQQTCLSYNKDLNSYVFTHRRSANWATTNPMGSGNIQATWINVVTNVKDSAILYYEAAPTNPGRYPGGTFYNPAGNTNIANTWLVATGPSLPGNGTAWGSYHSTRHLTGTSADQTNPATDKDFNAPNTPGGWGGSGDFINYDIHQAGTAVYVGGATHDGMAPGSANYNSTGGGIIGKCDFSTGSPVWSTDSIWPNYFYDGSATGNGYACEYGEGGRLAFGPSGLVGYWVGQGCLATNPNACGPTSADSMLAPVVYKTTDGGVTWAPVANNGYDWSFLHPELLKNVGALLATPARHFKLNYQHGIDVTVDANDVLHLVGTMIPAYQDGMYQDSLGFSYTYNYDYINNHPIMWDLMTDGSNAYGWKTMMIDSIASSWLGGNPANDTTASANPISDGSGAFLNYGSRLQVSRSWDGTKIFYSWADSDPSSTGSVYNIAPDIIMKAYDVTSGMVSLTTNVTNGLGVCWAHMMADVSYKDASNNWVVPCVYSIPRSVTAGVYNGAGISDHFWMDCGKFVAGDFVSSAIINAPATICANSVKSNNNAFVASVSNYPNPFNGTTNIVVKLNDSKSINVVVFDAIGNMVSTKTVKGNIGENTIVFDAAGLNAGVYYYTVTAGNEKTTKKMVIQK